MRNTASISRPAKHTHALTQTGQMVTVERRSFRVADHLQVHHALVADPVQVLRPDVPHDVGSTAEVLARPLLNFCHLQQQTHSL